MNLKSFQKPIKFILAGIANTLFGLLAFWFADMASCELWLSLLISLVSGIIFNFFNYGSFVFKILNIRIFPKFVAAYFMVYIANYLLISTMNVEKFPLIVTQGFLALPISLFSYCLMSFWVFKKRDIK